MKFYLYKRIKMSILKELIQIYTAQLSLFLEHETAPNSERFDRKLLNKHSLPSLCKIKQRAKLPVLFMVNQIIFS